MPVFHELTRDGWRQTRLGPTAEQLRGAVWVDGVWVGLDLGQSRDYSALCVVERRRQPPGFPSGDGAPEYHVRHLQRWRLQTPYPRIVDDVVRLMASPALGPPGMARLVVDATGVGPPVVDLLLQAG